MVPKDRPWNERKGNKAKNDKKGWKLNIKNVQLYCCYMAHHWMVIKYNAFATQVV